MWIITVKIPTKGNPNVYTDRRIKVFDKSSYDTILQVLLESKYECTINQKEDELHKD